MGVLCRALSEWRSVQVVVFGWPARCWVVRWETHGGISPSTLTSTLCLATLDKIIFDLLPKTRSRGPAFSFDKVPRKSFRVFAS